MSFVTWYGVNYELRVGSRGPIVVECSKLVHILT